MKWSGDDDRFLAIIIIGPLVLLILLGAVYLWPYSIEATVTEKYWRRDIAVERWQENRREGWDVPPGGRVLSSDWRYRETVSVDCGKNEDGSTKWCDKTVYDDWYVYTIWEWTHNRSFTSQGEDDPFWPDASDIASGHPTNPERLGHRTETYTTILESKDGMKYTFRNHNFAQWKGLGIERRCRVTLNKAGMVLRVELAS